MSQILICDNCGTKIEIEDSDEPLSIAESKVHDDENLQEISLCENCAQSQNHNAD